jgi:hypothetical protein
MQRSGERQMSSVILQLVEEAGRHPMGAQRSAAQGSALAGEQGRRRVIPPPTRGPLK